MPTTAMHSLCTFLPWPFHCSCCLHMHFNCASNAHALEIHKVKYIFYCSASVSSKSLLPYWCISLPYWKYSTKTDATFVYIYLHLTVLHRLKLIIQVLGLWNIWCFHGLKLIVNCSVSLRFMLVKLEEIWKEVQCPICLGENILSHSSVFSHDWSIHIKGLCLCIGC